VAAVEESYVRATPSSSRGFELSSSLTAAAAAIATFGLAFEHGGFAVSTWSTATVVVWGCILGIVLSGIDRSARVSGWAAASVGLLVLFAAFTGLSGAWASGAEAAFAGLNRTLLYAGVTTLVLLLNRERLTRPLLDGVTMGLVAVTFLALASRFFPSLVSTAKADTLVPDAGSRLSYPVGYWNALAVLAALAWPLLLRIATDPTRGRARAIALVPVPAIAAVVYLASSRAGAVTFVVGGILFIALSPRPWAAAGAAIVSVVAAGLGVAALARQNGLTDGALASAEATAAHHRGSLLAVIGAGIVGAIVFALADRRFAGKAIPARVGHVVIAALGVLVLVALVAAHPIRRWDTFSALPTAPGGAGYIHKHFLSANGNYRWQYWQATIDEFRTQPLVGRGAGSFEAWWDARGSIAGFVSNPHSLYFETLGDLGLVGLTALIGSIAAGMYGAARVVRRSRGSLHADYAAATSVFVAFAVAVGLDWVWDVPVIGVVAFALLGAALSALPPSPRNRVAFGRIAIATCAAVAILTAIDLGLADAVISRSQSAAARGNLAAAAHRARQAELLQPWAASAHVQMALVREAQHRFGDARQSIRAAIDHDHLDWRNWYIAARIENESGNRNRAKASYAQARRLNPNSPLLQAPLPAPAR
jgi:hypothetical protein